MTLSLLAGPPPERCHIDAWARVRATGYRQLQDISQLFCDGLMSVVMSFSGNHMMSTWFSKNTRRGSYSEFKCLAVTSGSVCDFRHLLKGRTAPCMSCLFVFLGRAPYASLLNMALQNSARGTARAYSSKSVATCLPALSQHTLCKTHIKCLCGACKTGLMSLNRHSPSFVFRLPLGLVSLASSGLLSYPL